MVCGLCVVLRVVALSHESESSLTLWSLLQDWAYQSLQLIDLRLALVLALIGFLVTVGLDSGGNPAAAADLVNPGVLPVPVAAVERYSVSDSWSGSRSAQAQVPALEAQQLATARRLRHGTLTSAIMTSNRLTEAHFFTDLPSGQ